MAQPPGHGPVSVSVGGQLGTRRTAGGERQASEWSLISMYSRPSSLALLPELRLLLDQCWH